MTIEHKRSSKGEIEDLIKARYSLIWITSPEETRVEESLRDNDFVLIGTDHTSAPSGTPEVAAVTPGRQS